MLNIDELSIIRIYADETGYNRNETIKVMTDSLSAITDDIYPLVSTAISKISVMTDEEFAKLDFTNTLVSEE